jgi:hypothetical protein
MSKEAAPGKKKVLRQSPGLKIEVKGETIKRISSSLKSIDKITSILNEEQGKKSQGGVMTTKSANFTASLAGTYYNCYAELNDPGPYDWYLINWYTGVYTYIGSSTDYINFNVQKPSMYGSYRVWGEGPYGAGFTGYQYLGDSYSGVTLSNGMLVFTNESALDNLYTRLDNAYEVHQANFIDSYDNLTDDQMNAYAEQQGFDEFLPMREFEAYWGFSSMRQYGETLINAYNGNSDLTEPLYDILDEIEQTLYNQSGQLTIQGIEGPEIITLSVPPPFTLEYNNCYPTIPVCFTQEYDRDTDTIGNKQARKIVTTMAKKGSNTAFMLRSTAKGKVIFYKTIAPKIRIRWMTKMTARIYGNAYAPNCVTLLDAFDIGPTHSKRRYRRKARKDWPDDTILFRWCQVTGAWNIPSFANLSQGLSHD